MKKEIRYIVQKKGCDNRMIPGEKEQLAEQRCLLVTVIEGDGDLEKGLREILINHAAKRSTL